MADDDFGTFWAAMRRMAQKDPKAKKPPVDIGVEEALEVTENLREGYYLTARDVAAIQLIRNGLCEIGIWVSDNKDVLAKHGAFQRKKT